jgi:hypothetical protein
MFESCRAHQAITYFLRSASFEYPESESGWAVELVVDLLAAELVNSHARVNLLNKSVGLIRYGPPPYITFHAT